MSVENVKNNDIRKNVIFVGFMKLSICTMFQGIRGIQTLFSKTVVIRAYSLRRKEEVEQIIVHSCGSETCSSYGWKLISSFMPFVLSFTLPVFRIEGLKHNPHIKKLICDGLKSLYCGTSVQDPKKVFMSNPCCMIIFHQIIAETNSKLWIDECKCLVVEGIDSVYYFAAGEGSDKVNLNTIKFCLNAPLNPFLRIFMFQNVCNLNHPFHSLDSEFFDPQYRQQCECIAFKLRNGEKLFQHEVEIMHMPIECLMKRFLSLFRFIRLLVYADKVK